MISGVGGTEAVPHTSAGKSLKDGYRWQLWAIVAINTLFLYGVAQGNAIKVDGLRALFRDAQNLLPVGVALIVATVLNGVLSAEAKARLAFFRWRHALPGHRAFSVHAVRDPRIDIAVLEKIHGSPLPVDPVEQNRVWYRMYRSVENDPAVRQAHRDYLTLRDYTGLCALFLVLYGTAGMFFIASMKICLVYLAILAAQFLFVRQSASNYGSRFVTTVLARTVGKEALMEKPKVTKPRARKPKAEKPGPGT